MHYTRWKRHGNPNHREHFIGDPAAALAARSKKNGECLEWTGWTLPNGYGRINVAGKMLATHRVAWELARGPIPDGMDVDHRCWNPICMNVEHLRLATRSQNNAYLNGPRKRKRDLPRGVTPNGPGYGAQVGRKWLGTYPTPELAGRVAERARIEMFGEFAGNTYRKDLPHGL